MTSTYKGKYLRSISFPLGGIGSGSIGLSGTGSLADWEIFNRPNKESLNGYSHFSIKAESDTEVIDARILQGDHPHHFMGGNYKASNHSWGLGHGPNRLTLSSMPHFEHVEFDGTFPIAQIKYEDDMFPGTVNLTAFNPFIPNNDKDSSIPGAFFNWTIHNSTAKTIRYTICLSVRNPFDKNSQNAYIEDEKVSMITMGSNDVAETDVKYGNLTIGTHKTSNISYQENWFRGKWFDDLTMYWNNFTSFGAFQNRSYEEAGEGDMCTLAVTIEVPAHEQVSVPFMIGWFYPNCERYWPHEWKEEWKNHEVENKWHNYYASLFNSSQDVIHYGFENWTTLYNDTKMFKDALYDSSLPAEVIDAIQGNISILKSPTCLRLDNGEFYGWEGVNSEMGSCEGSCTHVWNYAYALPFLFPNLERSMRDLDYKYNIGELGDMSFRLQLPLGKKRSEFRPCVDGQLGGVMKVYRDWKICGDTKWLEKIWPDVKKSIEYTWHPDNKDQWDPERSGVITGRQHHTLDMELFGPNSWLTGFYLGALKAGSEMARALGESETAEDYMALFNKGQKWVDDNLFNGQYYIQQVDVSDKKVIDTFDAADYWNDEVNEIKYQIDEGCIIDQVLAQWHGNLMGLGNIFNPDHCRTALKSLYDNNYKDSMRNHANPCRAYSLNDDRGIVICEWPEGANKPSVPVPYSEETMNGFEYAAACHMIQEGFIQEGLNIVKGVRNRYDGDKRNPWAEIECGNNYARSMASYALLLTFSGFKYNMVDKMIGFDPINADDNYRTFWSIDGAWGIFEMNHNNLLLKVQYGELTLKEFGIPSQFNDVKSVLSLDGILDTTFNKEDKNVIFKDATTLKRGEFINFVL